VSIESRGRLWALVCSPAAGWAAAAVGNNATHGGLGVWGAVALMAVFPAAIAALGNAALGRDGKAVAWAGIAAAAVCYSGLVLLAAVFFLTTPPEFFQ
jgi:hypothetical protein